MKKLEIAIRELAYFVCQSGNLTTEFFSNRDLDLANKAWSDINTDTCINKQKEEIL